MGSDDNCFILLKTALHDEGGDARLNPGAMGDKGGQRVMKIRPAVRPKGLIGNTTMDVFAIDDRQKPDHPLAFIIRFTGGKFDMHETTFFTRLAFLRQEAIWYGRACL
jgi:hypothetical protein